jgi:translation initiation factor 5A
MAGGGKKAIREQLRQEKRARLAAQGELPEAAIDHKAEESSDEEEDIEQKEQIDTGMAQFEASAGASLTYPATASSVRKGGFILINNFPCKVVSMSTSKTGKHGHAKIHFVAIDIFTNKKMDMLEASTHNVDIPNVSRTEYSLLDAGDDFLSLMDDKSNVREDIRTPAHMRDEIKAAIEAGRSLVVSVLSAMGQEVAMEYRDAPKGDQK